MAFRCRICGRADFRLSRLRSRDLGRVLAFQYPVRCRTCRERFYVFALRALTIGRGARHPQGPQPVENGSWED